MKNKNLFDLTGKHALITGGSRGIGLGIAREFTAAGAKVTLLGRTERSLQNACESISDGANYLVADVSEAAKAESVCAEAADRFGPVDILVNNAGTVRRGPAEDLSVEDFEEVMKLNVTGAFAYARAFARHRIAAAGAGKIINIASLMSEVSRRNTAAYTASKGAIKMLTKNMACEWAQFNIQSNGIGPGFIQTDFTEPLWTNPEFDEWVKTRTPQGRWGQPEDIGRTAVFLASPASDFVNGQILYVDGGLLATM